LQLGTTYDGFELVEQLCSTVTYYVYEFVFRLSELDTLRNNVNKMDTLLRFVGMILT